MNLVDLSEITPQNRLKNNDASDALDKANRLSQRMRDLYDFKTENEWPKRLKNRPYEETWISKSSSEEERHPPSGRRNSQDMEFNDRSLRIRVIVLNRLSNPFVLIIELITK